MCKMKICEKVDCSAYSDTNCTAVILTEACDDYQPLKAKEAHSSVSSSAVLGGSWTNGSWTIKWIDEDYLLIKGPYNQQCKICGGDFESMLSAMCAVEKAV